MREKTWFESGGARCAAWHYPGSTGGCVVMAGGGGVTKEPATDRYAQRFHAAGFSVLAFDYRCQGESEGTPRQVVRIRDQLADWDRAIAAARSLPEVRADRIALWGFSLSGGHVLKAAARNDVTAVIAQTPFADGPAAAPNALRHETIGVIARMPLLGLLDTLGGLLGRPPRTIPLVGPRGTVAMLTTPDAQDAGRALNPGNRHPEWQQTIAARSVLPIGGYRPGRAARKLSMPVLVVVAAEDRSALPGPGERVARRAARATLVRVPGGHYAPFLDQHEAVAQAELRFLREHLEPQPAP